MVLEKWRSVLGCRTCKANLIAYIADDMLWLICHLLRTNQQFIANIGSDAYSVRNGQSRQLRSDLSSNADETDLRVWLHCKYSCGIHKVIYSPDTDVYHIGLTVLSEIPEREVIVQLSKHTHDRARYLKVNDLVTALSMDPDLSQIPTHTRPQLSK